jgi:hypothetical protein
MIFSDLLKEDNKLVLNDLLNRCNSIKQINLNEIKLLAEESARATSTSSKLPDSLDNLLEKWNSSLNSKNPDYSVYGEDVYIAELWACWKVYSKIHLSNIQKSKSLITRSITDNHKNDKCIVDLGCGFAYTTATIKQIFPNADVFGTNLDNTLQMSVAKTMAKDYNFTMLSDSSELNSEADLVFASEYFEHFERPIDHLDYIVDKINPKAMLIANAFGPVAIGHFKVYEVKTNELFGYEWIDAKSTGKLFNKRMRELGYKKVITKLWNNRPAYWVRETND